MTADRQDVIVAGSHHQAILVWPGNELFCLEAFVVAWKLLPSRVEPAFAKAVETCIAILMRGPDDSLSDLNGVWGTYPNLNAFKADYRAQANQAS